LDLTEDRTKDFWNINKEFLSFSCIEIASSVVEEGEKCKLIDTLSVTGDKVSLIQHLFSLAYKE
jgi:hypothetical protein